MGDDHDHGSVVELCSDRYSLDMEAGSRNLRINESASDADFLVYEYNYEAGLQYWAEWRAVSTWKDDTDDWEEFTESLH